jgi:hypothetical protein
MEFVMAIVLRKGIVNAEYLAFDTDLRILTVNFVYEQGLTQFKENLADIFEETGEPEPMAKHVFYHNMLQQEYAEKLGADKNYDTAHPIRHSHFKYKLEGLDDSLLRLCQFKIPKAFTCIGYSRKDHKEIQKLHKEIDPSAAVD